MNFKQVFSAQHQLRISTSNEDDEIKLTEEDRNGILCVMKSTEEARTGDDLIPLSLVILMTPVPW